MKKILLTLVMALTLGLAAAAEMVAVNPNNKNDKIWITEEPCTDASVLVHVNPAFSQQMRAARAVIGGIAYSACWITMPGHPIVGLVFDDGTDGYVPLDHFKPADGA